MKRDRKLILAMSIVLVSVAPFGALKNTKQYTKNTDICKPIIEEIPELSLQPRESILVSSEEYTRIKNEKSHRIIEWKIGWINAQNVNVRENPNLNSKIYKTCDFNTQFEYFDYDNVWACVRYEGRLLYIHKDYMSDIRNDYIDYPVPPNKIKSYMPYGAITSYKQYDLQQIAYTGNYGIRMVEGRYCIAVGSAFTTELGTYIDLVLGNGFVIPCILADCKADKDTDSSNRITIHDGSAVEFIVDVNILPRNAMKLGDISYVDESWNSQVTTIRVYERKS